MDANSLFDKARDFLSTRAQAYRKVFSGHGHPEVVLRDLAKFCRAHESTFHPDPRIAAQLDGRREVWTRIQQHLKLSDDQLWDLFNPTKR